MSRIKVVLLLIVIPLISVEAQMAHSLYFMNEWSQRHLMNPSFAPQYGYLSLPVAGNFATDISSNVGVSTFIFPYNDQLVTFMHPSVATTDFLSKIKTNNYLYENTTTSLLSFGYYSGFNSFWSFDLSVMEYASVDLPGDFFRLAKLGMASSTNSYDISHLSTNDKFIASFGIGYSISPNDKWRIGWKVKLLAGMSSVSINYKRLQVDMNQNNWVVDADGEANIHSNMVSFEKDTAGIIDFSKSHTNSSNFTPAGYGAAVDLGFTYTPVKGLTLAASVSNLGAIAWLKSSATKGVAQGKTTFDGFTDVDITDVNVDNQVEQLKADAKKLIQFKQLDDANEYAFEQIDPSWNVSAEYSLFKNRDRDILIGVLYQDYYHPYKNLYDIVGTLSLRPNSWLMLSTNYTITGDGANSMGAALAFTPRWANIVLAVDCFNFEVNKQYVPIYPLHTAIQLGVSIPFYKNIDKRTMKKKKLYHNFRVVE